jgi:hypothetical protein
LTNNDTNGLWSVPTELKSIADGSSQVRGQGTSNQLAAHLSLELLFRLEFCLDDHQKYIVPLLHITCSHGKLT